MLPPPAGVALVLALGSYWRAWAGSPIGTLRDVFSALNPERLAVACAEEGRTEFLFTATPLRLVGATGAPAHPLVTF